MRFWGSGIPLHLECKTGSDGRWVVVGEIFSRSGEKGEGCFGGWMMLCMCVVGIICQWRDTSGLYGIQNVVGSSANPWVPVQY